MGGFERGIGYRVTRISSTVIRNYTGYVLFDLSSVMTVSIFEWEGSMFSLAHKNVPPFME